MGKHWAALNSRYSSFKQRKDLAAGGANSRGFGVLVTCRNRLYERAKLFAVPSL